jgi:hypothetical protein
MNPKIRRLKETTVFESKEREGIEGADYQTNETENKVSSPGESDPDLMDFLLRLSKHSSPFDTPHDYQLSQNAFEGEVGSLNSTKPLLENLPTVENKLFHIEGGFIPSPVAVQPTKRTPIHIAAAHRKCSIRPGNTNMDTNSSATRGSHGDPDQNFAYINSKAEPSIAMEGSIGDENMNFEPSDRVSQEPQTIESANNISRSSPSGVFASSSTYTAQSSPWTGI